MRGTIDEYVSQPSTMPEITITHDDTSQFAAAVVTCQIITADNKRYLFVISYLWKIFRDLVNEFISTKESPLVTQYYNIVKFFLNLLSSEIAIFLFIFLLVFFSFTCYFMYAYFYSHILLCIHF